MRTRVYIASAISLGDLAENIRRGAEAGLHLIEHGYAPLMPVLNCYAAGPNPVAAASRPGRPLSHREWCDVDLPWVAVSDAVLRLPGESVGADGEVQLALDHGIPVFYSVEELMEKLPASREHLAIFHGESYP